MKMFVKFFIPLVLFVVVCPSVSAKPKPDVIFIGDSRTVGLVGGWLTKTCPYMSNRKVKISVPYSDYQMLRKANTGYMKLIDKSGEKRRALIKGTNSFLYKIDSVPTNAGVRLTKNSAKLREYVSSFVNISFVVAKSRETAMNFITPRKEAYEAVNNVLSYANRYNKSAKVLLAIGYNDLYNYIPNDQVANKGSMVAKAINVLAEKYENLQFCYIDVFHCAAIDMKNDKINQYNAVVKKALDDKIKKISMEKVDSIITTNRYLNSKISYDGIHIGNIAFYKYLWRVIYDQLDA